MKKLILLLILLFLQLTASRVNAQGTWYQQKSGTEQGLFGIFFSGAGSGTAVGTGGTILHTLDGGSKWTMQDPGNPNFHLFDVYFFNSDTGIAVGISGAILRTTNGGESWTNTTNGIVPAVFSVSFIDEFNGTAVGHAGLMLRTTDGGVTWVKLPDAPSTLNAVFFVDFDKGYAVGDQGLVMFTTDAGMNWFQQPSGIQINLEGICFTDADNGILVGGSNLTGAAIYKTTDGGITWTTQYTIPNIALTGVDFSDPFAGTVVGWNGTVLSTSDGGNTWTEEISNTTNGLTSVFYVSPKIRYAVGSSGTILVNIDSSLTGISETVSPGEFFLEQNYPNPFNPSTAVRFALSERGKAELKVFDLMGNEVETLFNGVAEAGRVYEVEFNTRSVKKTELSSGIYFYRLQAGSYVQSKKMILLK